jgi:hypothetical protein
VRGCIYKSLCSRAPLCAELFYSPVCEDLGAYAKSCSIAKRQSLMQIVTSMDTKSLYPSLKPLSLPLSARHLPS